MPPGLFLLLFLDFEGEFTLVRRVRSCGVHLEVLQFGDEVLPCRALCGFGVQCLYDGGACAECTIGCGVAVVDSVDHGCLLPSGIARVG